MLSDSWLHANGKMSLWLNMKKDINTLIWVAHKDAETQGDKLSLYLAMVMLANYNQKWLVIGYNHFSSWEQSEEGIKLGDGKGSFLAERLNWKRTRVQQKGIHPLIYSFKEHSRNVYALSEERHKENQRGVQLSRSVWEYRHVKTYYNGTRLPELPVIFHRFAY